MLLQELARLLLGGTELPEVEEGDREVQEDLGVLRAETLGLVELAPRGLVVPARHLLLAPVEVKEEQPVVEEGRGPERPRRLGASRRRHPPPYGTRPRTGAGRAAATSPVFEKTAVPSTRETFTGAARVASRTDPVGIPRNAPLTVATDVAAVGDEDPADVLPRFRVRRNARVPRDGVLARVVARERRARRRP